MYMSGHAKLMPCRLNIPDCVYQFTVFRQIILICIARFALQRECVYTNNVFEYPGEGTVIRTEKSRPDFSGRLFHKRRCGQRIFLMISPP